MQAVPQFTYEIVHGEDFDPRCGVCTHMTEIVNTILSDWINDAIFIEKDRWEDFEDKKRLVILKPSEDPLLKRIGGWFVENFEETIKLAAIGSILLRDSVTEQVYEFKIKY